MALKVSCPGCGREYQVRESTEDRRFRCRECNESILVRGSSGSYALRKPDRSKDDDDWDDYVPARPSVTNRPKRHRKSRISRKAVTCSLIGIASIGVITAAISAINLFKSHFGGLFSLERVSTNAEVKEFSPPESGFVIKLGGMPETLRGRGVARNESARWFLTLTDGTRFSVYRSSTDDALPRWKESPLPDEAEMAIYLGRDTQLTDQWSGNKSDISRRKSQLAGVAAVETVYTAQKMSGTASLYKGRIRETRIGERYWIVDVRFPNDTPEYSDSEYDDFFNSFRVIDFACPPELNLIPNKKKSIDSGSSSLLAQSLVLTENFLEVRQQVPTRLIRTGPSPQPYQNEVPPPGVRAVSYPSGDLNLSAWLAVPEGKETSKNPALVYYHGGFAFAREDFDVCQPFLDAGFVVMTPMLRGENGNPGHYEMFRGELDDAIAAVRWLAQQPEVDPARIVAFGHSAGGGIASLVSLAPPDVPLLLTGSCCGLYDTSAFAEMADLCPFQPTDSIECRTRVLLGNQGDMNHRHVGYVGTEDEFFLPMARKALAGGGSGGLLEIIQIQGDHDTSLEPSLRMFLTRVQNELRSAAVPGSSASVPGFVSSGGSSAPAMPDNPRPERPKSSEDPYFKAQYRTARRQPVSVGNIRGFTVAEHPLTWIGVSGDKGSVQVISTRNGEVHRSFNVPGGAGPLAISGNGKVLVCETGDNRLRAYDLQGKSFVMNIAAPSGGVEAIIPTDAEGGFLIASKRNELLSFSVSQRRNDSTVLARLAQCEGPVTGIRLVDRDRSQVAVASMDGVLRILSLNRRDEPREFVLKAGPLTALGVSPDGKQAIAGSRNGTLLVDLASGAILRTLHPFENATAVALSPTVENAPVVAAIAYEQTRVVLVRTETGDLDSACHLSSREPVRHLSFNAEGTALAATTAHDPHFFTWDLTAPARSPSAPGPSLFVP